MEKTKNRGEFELCPRNETERFVEFLNWASEPFPQWGETRVVWGETGGEIWRENPANPDEFLLDFGPAPVADCQYRAAELLQEFLNQTI